MQKVTLTNLVKEHYFSFVNNRALADFLKVKIYVIREIARELGLKRMELEYFTLLQIAFLKKHYKAKGDKELAQIFQGKWPKQKGWTSKHIEKKRKYLQLHRTQAEIKAIHQRNVSAGCFRICPIKAWDKRGRAKEGEIRYWTYKVTGKKYPVIKINGVFIHWARWAWQQANGKIPKGQKVVFKDGNPNNRDMDNLELLSNADMARRNAGKSSQGLSDKYIAGLLSHKYPAFKEQLLKNKPLIELKRKQIILNRTIYESTTGTATKANEG